MNERRGKSNYKLLSKGDKGRFIEKVKKNYQGDGEEEVLLLLREEG